MIRCIAENDRFKDIPDAGCANNMQSLVVSCTTSSLSSATHHSDMTHVPAHVVQLLGDATVASRFFAGGLARNHAHCNSRTVLLCVSIHALVIHRHLHARPADDNDAMPSCPSGADDHSALMN